MHDHPYQKPSRWYRQKHRDKRLAEEVIECYRHGMRTRAYKRGRRQKLRQADYADSRRCEGMTRLHRGGTKYFNDNLSPLRRFLQRRLGQPWTLVYQELSQKLDRRSVAGQHVYQHLEEMVYRRVDKIEDAWFRTTYGGKVLPLPPEKWGGYPFFYLDAKGILRLWPRPPRTKRALGAER